ncbi:MAG: tRNA hydroxylase [Legionella sp.]|nr:MAG: tRNA hydroxylase [Legionella sp.]PJD98977.1 MAG: tRNA hydroxylase [Legionella sp.]
MLKRLAVDLQILNDFLKIKTPAAWLEYAVQHLDMLLLDHAHCERKAAANAIHLMSKYPEKAELIRVMSPLAREELLHFEKVTTLMEERDIAFVSLPPSQYGATLHRLVTIKNTNQRLCDQLLIGAIIEARSCERFNALIPFLQDKKLAQFYNTLIRSEARHFEEYLRLAKRYGGDVTVRLANFLAVENEFISSADEVFRFHSGIPN